MRKPARSENFAVSPVLIGAITTLMVMVSVFVAYGANRGLPFVSTYNLKAQLPNASQLVRAGDVRMGGFRIGVVDSISPRRRADGTTYAEISMKLQPDGVKPLPLDSTLIVRSRSLLGFKYVEIVPGHARQGYPQGATIPLAAATPKPVELDQVLNTFDLRTRTAVRNTLVGLGDGITGRGADLNAAIAGLPGLLSEVTPAMRLLAAPRTRLRRLVPALERTARIVLPAAATQGELVGNLNTTFSALAGVASPFLKEAIAQTPPTLATGISDFPRQRPFLADSAALARELQPGTDLLPTLLPQVNSAVKTGIPALNGSPALNARLAQLLDSIASFSTSPEVPRGIQRVDETITALDPSLAFLTPAQTTCNYASLWLRNTASILSEGDSHGTWQRFIIIIPPPAGDNSESGPSVAPANGPARANHVHINPYPNTASPGQTKECEAGNEPYVPGRTIIGNAPGNQGTKTDGQVSGG